MALSVPTIKNTKPGAKPKRLFDSNGLYLEVAPSGGKWWRLKYRIKGKEKRISLGVYPAVGLKRAREKRDEARQLLADGIDPSIHRKAQKSAKLEQAANSFEVIAREWIGKFSKGWSESHSSKIIRRLERDVFPYIGASPIQEITAPQLLVVLRRIEERGTIETAHRAMQNCGQIFRYAISTGRAERDPSADLKGALPPSASSHFATITDPNTIGQLLRAIEGYQGSIITKAALRLAPLVFVRPGELRGAEWAEIDLDKAEWRIPASRMKMKEPHIVPLSTQAVQILKDLYLVTRHQKFVFPGVRSNSRPMSENTVNAALRNLGYTKEQISGHGFRSMASTILNEQGWNRDAIERQLAHAERNSIRRAYNYAEYLSERKEMMQHWADYLDSIRFNK